MLIADLACIYSYFLCIILTVTVSHGQSHSRSQPTNRTTVRRCDSQVACRPLRAHFFGLCLARVHFGNAQLSAVGACRSVAECDEDLADRASQPMLGAEYRPGAGIQLTATRSRRRGPRVASNAAGASDAPASPSAATSNTEAQRAAHSSPSHASHPVGPPLQVQVDPPTSPSATANLLSAKQAPSDGAAATVAGGSTGSDLLLADQASQLQGSRGSDMRDELQALERSVMGSSGADHSSAGAGVTLNQLAYSPTGVRSRHEASGGNEANSGPTSDAAAGRSLGERMPLTPKLH